MVDNYMILPEDDTVEYYKTVREVQDYISDILSGMTPIDIIQIWIEYNKKGYIEVRHGGRT
jgi:hypothetical protein